MINMGEKQESLTNFLVDLKIKQTKIMQRQLQQRKVIFNRKYSESYLKHSFIATGNHFDALNPMCGMCGY